MKVLSLNLGSSSLKYSVHEISGNSEARLLSRDVACSAQPQAASDAAIRAIEDASRETGTPDAFGHRIVFGGTDDEPAEIGQALISRLESLQSLDPLHIPGAVAVIRTAAQRLPEVMQVACFDTAFYRDLPRTARAIPVPESDPLFRRYGFHGLSYESVCGSLGDKMRPRTIVAHLGNGASAVALADGKPVDMTMGFSPLGGLIMSSRPGDIDPGAILYLLERDGIAVTELRDILEARSGLRALSGGEGDVRKLCEREDANAAFALHMFVRSVSKAVGAFATVLGGVDLLVFTGGIGEHNSRVRDAIVSRVSFLNERLDVRVVRSDENLSIARHTVKVACERAQAH